MLKPLNEAADTLSGDPYPSVSLVLPLLFKLTQVNLAESSEDSTLLADLKNLARTALRNAYDREDTQQLLRMAMFLDPRLKRLPFFSKEEKVSVQHLIRKELTKVVVDLLRYSISLSLYQYVAVSEQFSCKKSLNQLHQNAIINF